MPELVVGRIPALSCLQAQRREVHCVRLQQGLKGLEAIRGAAGGLPVRECSRQELDKLAKGATHQGVVLEAAPLPVVLLDAWLRRAQSTPGLVVVLDCIEDPHNFGAIARSAAACGAQALCFGKRHAAPLSATACKSAAGAMEYIELVELGNLPRALARLKDAGYWVTGLEADGDKLLWEADFTGPTVLVIGSEGKGMRRLVRDACDFLVRIPLTGAITSFNASVSAAVALVECMRQRQG